MCSDVDGKAPDLKPLFEAESGEQVAERMGGLLCGAVTTLMVSLADTLGIFRYMSDRSTPCSTATIAGGTKLHERWVREMLYQLASARLVSTDEDAKYFWLTEAQAGVLANEVGPKASPLCLCGIAQEFVEGMGKFHRLQESIRTGHGMTYDEYGEGMACAVCRDIGVWTRHCLAENIPSLPGLHERLEKGAVCADIGCGAGEVLKVLAKAYPKSTFHGFDTSKEALTRAVNNIEGIPNISLKNPDKPGEQMAESTYDFIITMDAIHDMAHPDQVLSIARKGLKDDGWGYLIADFKCQEKPADNIAGDAMLAQIGYGTSVMLCLNSAMSDKDSMGLGTLGWHPQLAEKMLREAGFKDFEQLNWDSDFNIFYWAKP